MTRLVSWRSLLTPLLLSALLILGGSQLVQASSSTQFSPRVTRVAIQNFAYHPAALQVSVGTTVTWTNQDTVSHTVTFDNGMAHSGRLAYGKSFSYMFTQPGTYHYHCALHPSMVATVTVT